MIGSRKWFRGSGGSYLTVRGASLAPAGIVTCFCVCLATTPPRGPPLLLSFSLSLSPSHPSLLTRIPFTPQPPHLIPSSNLSIYLSKTPKIHSSTESRLISPPSQSHRGFIFTIYVPHPPFHDLDSPYVRSFGFYCRD